MIFNYPTGNEPDTTRRVRRKKHIHKTLLLLFVVFLIAMICIAVFALLPRDASQADNAAAPSASSGLSISTSTPESADASGSSETQPVSPTPATTPEPTPPVIDNGMWGDKFEDHFSSVFPIKTDNSYVSHDISVTIDSVLTGEVAYYVADIYIRNLDNFQTAFANGEYRKGTDETLDMATENDAVIAISGDYCTARDNGIVIRNGEFYRDSIYKDILIMYNDGSMETFSPEEFDYDAVTARGVYQGWSFGPKLLDNGLPMDTFNSSVTRSNPRCAIGYYEPGHYCFVLVDGRQSGYSKGMTMTQLSQLFYDLGCTEAYNMDGGQTAVMVYLDALKNIPYNGGRKTSDIVFIAESNQRN